MGPTLSLLAKRFIQQRQPNILYPDLLIRWPKLLDNSGVVTISADLMKDGALDSLPDAENIIYMAGRKFSTTGQELLTWAINVRLPVMVAERFRHSRIVVFFRQYLSMVPVHSEGATEQLSPQPKGDYAMSCLGRKGFEYASLAIVHQYLFIG